MVRKSTCCITVGQHMWPVTAIGRIQTGLMMCGCGQRVLPLGLGGPVCLPTTQSRVQTLLGTGHPLVIKPGRQINIMVTKLLCYIILTIMYLHFWVTLKSIFEITTCKIA
jgi:hypothetical protein